MKLEISLSSTALPSDGVAVESSVGGVPATVSSVIVAPDSSTALPLDGVDMESNVVAF
jgi:hypothetical protein